MHKMSVTTLPSAQCLEEYLKRKFQQWQPRAPEVLERTKRSVTLQWLGEEPFGFMKEHLLYKVQRKEKVPAWVTVYSGGKTLKAIEDLAPSHPHKFRLKVILKSTAVSMLSEEAIKHYGNENAIYNVMEIILNVGSSQEERVNSSDPKSRDAVKKPNEVDDENTETSNEILSTKETETFSENFNDASVRDTEKCVEGIPLSLYGATKWRSSGTDSSNKWVESRWSEETWTSTDTDGTSAVCFCMAVRCGYFKQVQIMVEERPSLIGAINCNNGLTPLATAVRKGDLNTVKYVLSLGAEVDQPTIAGQTPLHLAVLAGYTAIADSLIDKGANFQARDFNGLRVEHYAVDSCELQVVKYILDKGGDVAVKDSNGWTPLFRAVCQGAKTEVIEELLLRGSSPDVTDRRGLSLVSAARLLKNRHGRPRDRVLRLVDVHFPHEKALANFTRLTKKIYSVHTLFK